MTRELWSAAGFDEPAGAEPRVSATAVQTVGGKRHDGFTLAVVLE